MGPDLLLDTDILIDYLRGHAAAVALVSARADDIVISAVTVTELYAGVRGVQERTVLDVLVSQLRVAPVTRELAVQAGLYKREYGKSHGIGLGDAVVAATAEVEKAELATLNVRHYPMVKGLRPAYSKK